MTHDSSNQVIDWIAVDRVGHELQLRHGRKAYAFAARLADQAEASGDIPAAAYWRAVVASLMPRDADDQR